MSIKADILLVSQSNDVKQSIRSSLSENGYKLLPINSLTEAYGIIMSRRFDLVMYDGDPAEADYLLKEARKQNRDLRAIVIAEKEVTADLDSLIQLGIEGCIFKPVRETEIRFEVAKVLKSAVSAQPPPLEKKYVFHESRNPNMAELYNAAVEKIAKSDSTVLIMGESGTGKELMAQWIYSHSPRQDKPLVKVSCAVLPEGVLESEMFGHEKGSFTGAYTKRKGRFELADKGTIFLDEIGDVTPAIQSKFLRVLQEREFQRLGSNNTIKVDVRIIAATSKDLWQEVEIGKFREDLYYRLNVISLKIPPLRERREDIPSLAHLFIRKFGKRAGKIVSGFDNQTMQVLTEYDWQGNVRELENVVERAVVMASGNVITLNDLPSNIKKATLIEPGGDSALKKARETFEKDYIVTALARFEGNVSKTAKHLELARKNLQGKLKKYDIDAGEYR